MVVRWHIVVVYPQHWSLHSVALCAWYRLCMLTEIDMGDGPHQIPSEGIQYFGSDYHRSLIEVDDGPGVV